jgi:hypothetical protein
MTCYVNPCWACALFRNNKQHVVLGQKRKCQRVEESGLWRIQRERGIEVQYLPNGRNAGYIFGISWTVGTNWRKCYASKLTLKWQRFCFIVKPRHVAFFSQSFFIEAKSIFIYCYASSPDTAACRVCLPRKYGRFMLLIDTKLLLPGARLHILNNIYRKWS